jgi:hypothetical protein
MGLSKSTKRNGHMFANSCLFSYVSDASHMWVPADDSKRLWPAMFTNHVCFPMSWIVSNMWVAVDNSKRVWPAMFTKPCLFSYVSDVSDMWVAVENSKRSWPANTVTLYHQICSYGSKLRGALSTHHN